MTGIPEVNGGTGAAGVRRHAGAGSARTLWGLALRIVLLAAAVAALAWAAVELHLLLLRMVMAVVLACGLARLSAQLEARGAARWAAVLVVYAGIVALLAVAGIVVVPPTLDAVEGLVGAAPEYGERATQALHDLQRRVPWLPPVDEDLAGAIRGLSSELGSVAAQAANVARFALGFFRGVLSTLLVLVVSLYLVLDREAIRDYALDFVPEARRERASRLLDRMAKRTGSWLLGQVALMVTVGALCYLGLSVIGVPFAVLLAVLAGIGEIVPIVGPIVTAVPAVALAATVSPWHAAAAAGLYTAVQQAESYLLTPKIMHHAVKIHPLAVLLAVLVGTELWGILGALVAVPAAASAAIILDELRPASRRRADGSQDARGAEDEPRDDGDEEAGGGEAAITKSGQPPTLRHGASGEGHPLVA